MTRPSQAQWVKIGPRSEPLGITEFVCADGLYINKNNFVCRYDRVTCTWNPVFEGRLLATSDSSMLYTTSSGTLMFTDNLGRTSMEVERPKTVIVNYYVHKRSVVLLDHNNYLFVTREVGRFPFSKTVNFLSRPLNQYDIKVHWYDSLIIAHHNDYRQLYVLTLDSIPSSRATDELDSRLTSVSSSHGHTLFNYNGRLSFTRGDLTSKRTLQTPYSSTSISVFGSSIIVFASDGTQYVTHDTGLTWEIQHILPSLEIPSLKSFVLGDSLYVYNANGSEYYASDSAISRWWVVSSGVSHRGSHFTHAGDTLFAWSNEGRVTVIQFNQPSQRPEVRRSFFTDVVAGFTVADGSMVMFQDQRMFRSVDRGISWDTTVFERNTILAGYSSGELWRLDGRLFVSTDNGYTWQRAARGYDSIAPTSFAYHNGSYIVMQNGECDVHTLNDSFYGTIPPWSPRMSSFASFGDICFIVSKDSLLHEFRNGRWYVCTSDYGYNNNASLLPNDNFYYGVNWHDLPIRVDNTKRTEIIKFDSFPGSLITFTGPYVIYFSPITGTYVYIPDQGTTSVGTNLLRSISDVQTISFHDNVIDLSEFRGQLNDPPSVFIFSLSGARVLKQENTWTVHTNELSPGVYVVVVTSGNSSSTSLINVVSN